MSCLRNKSGRLQKERLDVRAEAKRANDEVIFLRYRMRKKHHLKLHSRKLYFTEDSVAPIRVCDFITQNNEGSKIRQRCLNHALM